MKSSLYPVQQLYDQASTLDDIQGSDKDVTSTLVIRSLFDALQEGLSLLEPHPCHEPLQKEALRFKLAVCLAKRVDQQGADLVVLLSDLEEVLAYLPTHQTGLGQWRKRPVALETQDPAALAVPPAPV